MSAEVVRYRLQIQLYEWKAGDTDEVFNANKAWGTPFLDLGVMVWRVQLSGSTLTRSPRIGFLIWQVDLQILFAEYPQTGQRLKKMLLKRESSSHFRDE